MKTSSTILVILICLTTLTGCRGAKKRTESLELELRHQERKIWTYTSYIEDYQRLLDDCRAENKRLRDRLGDDDDGPRRSRSRSDDAGSDGGLELGIPQIEIPMGDVQPPAGSVLGDGPLLQPTSRPPRQPPTKAGARSSRDRSARLPDENTDSEVPLHDVATSDDVQGDPREVETLKINKLFSGGNNTDGVPGDEGISLLIETRNAQGDVIPPDGRLDISLLDPSAANEAEARLGLWRLSAQEVREKFRNAAVGKGIQLDLPWQNAAPRRERLRLFVRLTSPDEKRIQTDREIKVELPGRSAAQQRRQRFRTARANRLRAMTERTEQEASMPHPQATSAPLWDGKAAAPSAAVRPTETTTQVQPPPGTSTPSGWSRSQQSVPTRATPQRLLKDTSQSSTARRTTKSPTPVPRRTATAVPRRTATAQEPKIQVAQPPTEPTSKRASPSTPREERAARQPRAWSPYR